VQPLRKIFVRYARVSPPSHVPSLVASLVPSFLAAAYLQPAPAPPSHPRPAVGQEDTARMTWLGFADGRTIQRYALASWCSSFYLLRFVLAPAYCGRSIRAGEITAGDELPL
jgi:hypothetical protein